MRRVVVDVYRLRGYNRVDGGAYSRNRPLGRKALAQREERCRIHPIGDEQRDATSVDRTIPRAGHQ